MDIKRQLKTAAYIVGAVTLLFAFCSGVSAEIVTLTSGERVRGEVVKIDEDGAYTILLRDGAVVFEKDAVFDVAEEMNLDTACLETARSLRPARRRYSSCGSCRFPSTTRARTRSPGRS